MAAKRQQQQRSPYHFVEVDFENVIRRKAQVVRSIFGDDRRLKEKSYDDDVERICANYILLACDLVDAESVKSKLLNDCDCDPNRPTLFLAECVLNYLPVQAADNLLSTLSSTFHNSSFIVYEQVEPNDKFGRTMVKHFQSIHSPLSCIDTYPNVISHVNRYRNQLGFPCAECFPIGHLYDNYLSPETRTRIARLDIFDEYEMWHAKCAHYIITLASTMEDVQKRWLGNFGCPTTFTGGISLSNLDSSSLPISNRHKLDNFRRFGHRSSALLSSSGGRRLLFSCGGWGIDHHRNHRRQGRLRRPSLFNLDLDDHDDDRLSPPPIAAADQLEENVLLERCYHTATSIGGESCFVFGGRHGPAKPLRSPLVIRLVPERSEDVLEITALEDADQAGGPCARWRHSAVAIIAGADQQVLICGGLTIDDDDHRDHQLSVVLSDSWIYRPDHHAWTRLPDMPIAVHSHSTCYDRVRNVVIVIGGLLGGDGGGAVCEHMQVYFVDSERWAVVLAPIPFHIYGSVCFWIDGGVIVSIGGASPAIGECHYLATMRLVDEGGEVKVESSRVYRLASRIDDHNDNDNDIGFMLMNHDAVLITDQRGRLRILVTGGGGNCFSFGTCFNDALLEIDISPIVK